MKLHKLLTKKTMTIALGLCALLAVFAYFAFSGEGQAKVNGIELKALDVNATINTSGMLYYETIVEIKPEISGKIKEMRFKVGDSVKQNDILAVLENTDRQLSVRQAENNLSAAAQNLESIKTDRLQSSNEEIVQAQAALLAAQSAYDAERKLYDNQSQLITAQEKVSASKAAYEKKKADYDRVKTLFEAKSASSSDLENAKYDMDMALSDYTLAVNNLNSTLPDKSLVSARSALEQAQSRLRQAQTQRDALLAGGSTYKSAELQIKDAQIALDSAKDNLKKTEIAAPFDGIVLGVSRQAGELCATSEILLTIAQRDHLFVKVALDEKYFSKVSVGQRAQVTPAGTGKPLSGTLRKVLPSADSQRGTVNLEIALDAPSAELKNEMTVNIDIITGTYQNAIAVNKKYLTGDDGNSVFVLKNGTAQAVTVGIAADLVDRVIVDSGLKSGDVILEPAGLQNGARVDVKKQ